MKPTELQRILHADGLDGIRVPMPLLFNVEHKNDLAPENDPAVLKNQAFAERIQERAKMAGVAANKISLHDMIYPPYITRSDEQEKRNAPHAMRLFAPWIYLTFLGGVCMLLYGFILYMAQ